MVDVSSKDMPQPKSSTGLHSVGAGLYVMSMQPLASHTNVGEDNTFSSRVSSIMGDLRAMNMGNRIISDGV